MDLLIAARALTILSGLLSALALAASPTLAQQPGSSEPPALVDVGDLWRMLRHKEPPAEPGADEETPRQRMLVIAPVIGSKPHTGVVVGGAGNIAFYGGDPQTTHISTSVFSVTVSAKGQTMSNVRFATFTAEDRWLIVGDNRFQWTSQDTFGLGTSTATSDAVNAKYDFFRVYETAYRRIGPDVFVGAGFHFNTYRDIRPGTDAETVWGNSPNVAYSQRHRFPLESSTSAGVSVNARFDDRDSQINPMRGWLVSGGYRTFFEGFLGGDSSWEEIDFDVRTYRALTRNGRHRVAIWIFGDLVTGGTAPYFDLPATGMDTFGRSGRGYQEGRFRGERLLYGELEYRTTLTANGLVGMVAFLNATTVSAHDSGERLFHSGAPAGGVGARVLLNRRSKTNLCVDVGFGREGSRGVYLAVQEAF